MGARAGTADLLRACSLAKDGAQPVTISIDICFMGTDLEHAAAVHGVAVPTEHIRLGRIALNRLGLTAKSAERERRPSTEELDLIIKTAKTNSRQITQLARVINAVATAPPQDEISRAQSQPCCSIALHSTPSFAKSMARIDGAVLMRRSPIIVCPPRRRSRLPRP
jgi:hypothetical protein